MFGLEDELFEKIDKLKDENKKWKEIADKLYRELDSIAPESSIVFDSTIEVIEEYKKLLNNLS